jgi:hypothetical protein
MARPIAQATIKTSISKLLLVKPIAKGDGVGMGDAKIRGLA